MFAAIFFSQNT